MKTRWVPNRMRQMARTLRGVRDGLKYGKDLLSTPVTSTDALAAVRARMPQRGQAFLEMLERTVFGYQDSPYRALLADAGYDLERVRTLVRQEGVESTLRRLCADGVYIAIEEFKGHRPAQRGGKTYRFSEKDFHNPLVTSGLPASSGGTRSQGIATTISVANHRMGAEHLSVALAAYGVEAFPAVIWLSSPGASLWGVLTWSAMWNAPPVWFTQLPARWEGFNQTYPLYMAIRAWARFKGLRLPVLNYAPPGEEWRVLRWVTSPVAERGCTVMTTPSSALRLALLARQEGRSLAHVTFVTIGEPLTSGKLGTIRSVGARAFSSLGFTEFGRATYGCASARSEDETHVCLDAVAVIQRRRSVDRLGQEVDALLFTALRSDARRILLNMETGDYAHMFARDCGCLLETLGWNVHLENIRSFEKLNAEGRLFFGSQLIALVEETLPAEFGGDPTDYQVLEQEDEEGFTRLSVLVHPRLGPLPEDAILRRVQDTLAPSDKVGSEIWSKRGTIRVLRLPPMLTKAGKLMPLHHLGAGVELQDAGGVPAART